MSRFSSARSGAALAAITLVMLAAPLSAQAVDDNGESLGAISVSPATGGWDDVAAVGGTFSCPVVDGAIDTYIYTYVTGAGSESPALDGPSGALDGAVYAFTNSGATVQATEGSVATFAGGDETAFPADYGVWFSDVEGDIPDLRGVLDPATAYSLVLACSYDLDGEGPEAAQFIADSTGHIPAAWAGLTVTSAGWSVQPGAGGGGGGGGATTATLALTASATASTSVTLSAAVTANGAAATDAAGSVEFFNGTQSLGTAPVTAGVANLEVASLTPSTPYTFAASFTPAEGSAYSAVTAATLDVTTLAAGAVPVVVPSPTPTPVVTPAAANTPFAALTDWVAASSATPTGITGLFAGILVLCAVALVGWRMIFLRRPTVTGPKDER